MAEEAIRKMIERLRTRLPFWDDMIETTRIGNKAARRRRTGVSHHIFCRAGDVFPWEQCGFFIKINYVLNNQLVNTSLNNKEGGTLALLYASIGIHSHRLTSNSP